MGRGLDMDNTRPLTVEVIYEDSKVEQYSFPQVVERSDAIVAGEWISLPNDLTDAECEWVMDELGPKMRSLGS